MGILTEKSNDVGGRAAAVRGGAGTVECWLDALSIEPCDTCEEVASIA